MDIHMEIYVVKPGDSVDTIAENYGISPSSLIYANQLTYPYPLAIGQALLIPVSSPAGSAVPASPDGSALPASPAGSAVPSSPYPAFTNGYAYPFINRDVLTETLPFLSTLSVFSYGFTTEGELIAPIPDDTFLITAARKAGTRPILTLTPFGSDGLFNNYLITTLVNQEQKKAALLQNLLAVLQEKDFAGVDIDFEYILPEDRIPFAAFVSETRDFLSPYGYRVSVALAPKTSDDQPGLLYEGKDYRLLGEAADSVLLMTYEWGYTYGPPMAVAPIHKVREVVDYAVTRITPSHIDLGIPNYGYDWTLPYERGVTAARTIGNREAVELAITYQAQILFDETAMSPYFYYEAAGRRHEVWFEDVRSLREKYALLPLYGLRGIGVWQIMRLFRAGWLLFQDQFEIIRM